MYKKIVLLIVLCFLVVMSCSSPSSPNSGSNGDIVNGGGSGETGGGSGSDSGNGGNSGNTGDGGNTGGIDVPWTDIEEPLMPPVPILDAEAMQYGIDISQDDTLIKEKIKTRLEECKKEGNGYKIIFIGTPKAEYSQRSALARMVLEAAKEIFAYNVTIDISKIYFNERKIKYRMFEGANGLNPSYKLTFIFPENIIRLIDNSAFIRNYQALQEITIPDSVIGIGATAFQQGLGLKTVKFGENSKLEYIGDSAFSYCPISEITIPASVNYLGTKPFGDSLTTVTYLGTSPNAIQHGGDVFPATAKTLILPNVENPQLSEWQNFLGGNFTEVKQQ